jgi:transcriptional regulator with XRE-family HTH domain
MQHEDGSVMADQTLPAVSDESRRASKLTRDLRRVIRDLKNIREARGMSASLVADIIGVHRSVVSKFENQIGDPKLSTLLRYAHAVGADLELTVVTPLLDDKPATTNSRSKTRPR